MVRRVSQPLTAFTALTALTALVAACGSEPEPLDPIPQVEIDLAANVWRRGVIVAPVAVAPLNVVTELVLEVDGVQVAVIDPATLAPPAPMTVSWDSSTAVDGEHTLRLVATTATGRSGDDSVTFLTDNTVPVITLVGQSATETPLDLQFAVVENESGIVNAGLRVGSVDVVAIDRSTWRSSLTGCIAADMQAFVTDRVGNTGVHNFRLDAIDSCDRDCDEVRATGTCGGLDCDDALASIPQSTDGWGDGLDANCDGVDGTDVDGDGVPGSSAGTAPDCNDADPTIHGYWSNWVMSPRLGRTRGDVPDTSIVFAGADMAVLYATTTFGVLDFAQGASGQWAPSIQLASDVTGQDAALVYDANGRVHVTFSRVGAINPSVVHATNASGAMVSETVADGVAPLLAIDGDGVVNILFEAPGNNGVRHARKLAAGWNITALPSSFGSTARGSLFVQNGVLTLVHGAGSEIRIDRFANDAWTSEVVSAPGASYLRAAPMGTDIIIAAAGSQSRTHVFGGPFGAWPGDSFPFTGGYGELSVGADGRVHLVYESSSFGIHRVYAGGVWYQEPGTLQMSPIRGDASGRAHAITNSHVPLGLGGAYLLTEGTPHLPAADSVGDGVDQDCDGSDG